jgi:hypothetical protein
MLGNGFYEARMGQAELGRQLELALLARIRVSCEKGSVSSASRMAEWFGGQLIAVGEALCAHSQQQAESAWQGQVNPDLIRSQVG